MRATGLTFCGTCHEGLSVQSKGTMDNLLQTAPARLSVVLKFAHSQQNCASDLMQAFMRGKGLYNERCGLMYLPAAHCTCILGAQSG